MASFSSRRSRRLFQGAGTLLVVTALVAGAVAHATSVALTDAISEPPAPALCLVDHFLDQTWVSLAASAGWETIRLDVPAWRVHGDHTLWLQMRLEHWNRVPLPLRETGLVEMFRRYPHALDGPDTWNSLGPLDWDAVPQPVRAMAVLRMVDERVDEAARAGAYGLGASMIAETVAAIIMVESWFEHRAVNVNPNGDRDLGLAQASAYCRRRLGARGRGEAIGHSYMNGLTEDEYFDPWKATGVATAWFLTMLSEAEGDRKLAVRAYHRGIRAARTGLGQDYLEQVEAKRLRFVRNRDAPDGWRFVFDRYRRPTISPSTAPSTPAGPPLLGSGLDRIAPEVLSR